MSMLLTGENGTEFELGLIEQPFSDLQDGANDDLALTIAFRVAAGDESWEETSPCLNTFEVLNLAQWLEDAAAGTPDIGTIELLAPELRFELVGVAGERVTLRINFHLEDRPDQFKVDAPTDMDHVDLKMDRAQLKTAVKELKRDLDELHLPTQTEEPQGLEQIPDESNDLADVEDRDEQE
jgi:hypothetical protein